MSNNYPRLIRKFYQQNTFELAQALLGKYLVRKCANNVLIGKIVETEAYYGPNDKASHASRGKTERTKIMFDQPGLAYIYLVYGMYYCFNIVTEAKDFPAAILIRALEPVKGIKQMYKNRQCHGEHSRTMTPTGHPSTKLRMTKSLANGPAKLCQALKIDKQLNGTNLITSTKLYLAENPQGKITPSQIQCAKRIGIDYAGSYKHKFWRYYLKDNKFISKF
ncbi:MAG: DNA-3-methyladenine glycosylase [Candidatus Parcubacteria bacterium]|nr:DNA-3-methyladenine glycosylase [Candidatus Parcubacteria bacterium]